MEGGKAIAIVGLNFSRLRHAQDLLRIKDGQKSETL